MLLVLGPLTAVAIEHLLPSTLLVGLRVSAPSTNPSGKSLSTSNKVSSTRVNRAAFSSESGTPTPKGVIALLGWPQETVSCSVQS